MGGGGGVSCRKDQPLPFLDISGTLRFVTSNLGSSTAPGTAVKERQLANRLLRKDRCPHPFEEVALNPCGLSSHTFDRTRARRTLASMPFCNSQTVSPSGPGTIPVSPCSVVTYFSVQRTGAGVLGAVPCHSGSRAATPSPSHSSLSPLHTVTRSGSLPEAPLPQAPG